MNKKIFLVVCAFTANLHLINADTTKVTDDVNRLTVTSPTSDKQTPAESGKKITCGQMDLLNTQLTLFPMGTIRMRLASKKIREVLKNIETKKSTFNTNKSAEKTFIAEQLAMIIKPVQEFFEILQDPIVLNMVKPIIADALSSPKKSYVLDYCNSKKNILTFCDEEITTVITLDSMSKELLQFFSSIQLSLSDKAKDAAKQLEDKLKQQQADKKKTEKK